MPTSHYLARQAHQSHSQLYDNERNYMLERPLGI